MKGLWNWAKEKISNVAAPIAEAAGHATRAVRDYLVSTDAGAHALNYFSQFYAGFTQFLDPIVSPKWLWSAKKTREEAWESVKDHAQFIAPIVAYEFCVKGLLHSIPYLQDSPVETLIDVAAKIYFTKRYAHFCVDNFARNLNVAKAACDEQPVCEHYKGCECETTKKIQAALASPFYYLGKSATAHVVSSYVPGGEWVTFPLTALVYGQGWLEYKLAAASMCTRHREEVLEKNHMFEVGMGLSFSSLISMSNYLLRYYTGIDNYFVTAAITSLLNQYFIITSYRISTPLPGHEDGLHIFHPGKRVVEDGLKRTSARMFNWLNTLQPSNDLLTKLDGYKATIGDFVLSRYVVKFFAGEDIFDKSADELIDDFVQRPAYANFLKLHDKGIYEVVDGVIQKRKEIQATPLINQIVAFSAWIPDWMISENSKKLLPVLANPKLDGVFEGFRARLDRLPRQSMTREDVPIEVEKALNVAKLKLEQQKRTEQQEVAQVKDKKVNETQLPILQHSLSEVGSGRMFAGSGTIRKRGKIVLPSHSGSSSSTTHAAGDGYHSESSVMNKRPVL